MKTTDPTEIIDQLNHDQVRRLSIISGNLQEATAKCQPDMHEPGNQGVSAVVAGYNLDNAMGPNPHHNCGEFTVGIKHTDPDTGNSYTDWFNLADLIALARTSPL